VRFVLQRDVEDAVPYNVHTQTGVAFTAPMH
jgi:hypothetical protein